ncbi:MAG: YhjD/YihY/BrkB family envelope integrity protein [Paludibacteraceae bacterium]
MWRRTSTEFGSRSKRLGYQALRTIVLVVRGFTDNKLNVRANSLTYSLVFAFIPILAMVVAIAKGFGVSEVIENLLNESFLGETNLVPTIMEMVDRYLETAQGGVFLGVGLLILIWAVYSFFRNVESAFNEVWDVKQSRSVVHQLVTYIAILVIVPIMIVATSGISIFIDSMVSSLQSIPFFATLRTGLVRFIQFAVVWAIFTWMYISIPNTKVRFWSGVIPGVLMGTLFMLLQMLSMHIIVLLSRTSIVYGAFATIPILLTWLQWTSLLILIGAQMSFAIQNNEQFEYEHDLEHMSRRYKDCITLYLLSLIIRRFEADEAPLTAREIASDQHLPVRLVLQLLSRLEEIGLLRAVYVEGKEERTYQPALDTHKITIGMVFDRIDMQGNEEFIEGTNPEMQLFWQKFRQLKAEHNTLNAVKIREI